LLLVCFFGAVTPSLRKHFELQVFKSAPAARRPQTASVDVKIRPRRRSAVHFFRRGKSGSAHIHDDKIFRILSFLKHFNPMPFFGSGKKNGPHFLTLSRLMLFSRI
jgi:hypothetical protein